MPLVRPVTVMGLTEPVAVKPPGLDVTVYCSMGAPPSETGGVNETIACPSPADAVTLVGAPGAVTAACGVTLADAAEAELVPALFVAVTVKV